jgi:S1-C subfamily serine protease
VTCEHALGATTKAFTASDHSHHFPVTVIKRNPALDVAIIVIEGLEIGKIPRGDSTKLEVLSPVAVYGYPNYRLGDSGLFMPGHVVGHRTVSTIRRILTNASIVQGASGGVCVDKNNEAIGIAVTGARSLETCDGTENHGIVPIEVIDILLSQS